MIEIKNFYIELNRIEIEFEFGPFSNDGSKSELFGFAFKRLENLKFECQNFRYS